MGRYRKKPVVITAVQWKGNNIQEVRALEPRKIIENTSYLDGTLTIKTLEGSMTARINDWIIKGVHGELYPCKPDIFKKTYEEEKE